MCMKFYFFDYFVHLLVYKYKFFYFFFFFFFNDTATTEIYTLSLHDALPISKRPPGRSARGWETRWAWRWRRRISRPSSIVPDTPSWITGPTSSPRTAT